MLVGVSWRESTFALVRKQVRRRLRSILVRKFCSSENNMPSSDTIDCSDANSSQSVELRFAKLSENAVKPTRGSKLAAGFDLHRLIRIHFCLNCDRRIDCNVICYSKVC